MRSRMGTVFSFTFARHTGRKGYRMGTAAGMLLCFLLPLLIMMLVEALSGPEAASVCEAKKVYIVDNTTPVLENGALFETERDVSIPDAVFVLADHGFEAVYEQAQAEGDSLLLVIDGTEEGYQATVVRPEDSVLGNSDVSALTDYVEKRFPQVLVWKSGLGAEQLAALAAPVSVEYGLEEAGEDAEGQMREILGMVLPYLNIMLLYFLILFYGQSISTCVLMEKTSKLMDTFLLSVRPRDLLMGKVFATVLAAFLQVALWLAALAGGFAAGTFSVRQMNPETDMLLIRLFEGLKLFGGLFSVSGCVLGCGIILAGFLLYCALGAIGGAIAGKPEDLSTTNMIFILVLIVSFFATLQGTSAWMDWVPFTAVLVTPGRMLAGETTFLQGLGSLAVVVLSSLVLLAAAGKIYRGMALYKGKLPKPGEILALLRK